MSLNQPNNILQYFPILGFAGIIFAFWTQSKNFVLKAFHIFWKSRVIPQEHSITFYKELATKSKILNFDDYHIISYDLFSVKDKKYLPFLLRGYKTEVFLYKYFIPIFIFGADNNSIKIQYLKGTFGFEKFLKMVCEKVHEQRKEDYAYSAKNCTNFYISEIRGRSAKMKEIEGNQYNQKGALLSGQDSEKQPQQHYYTMSPQKAFEHGLNNIIGFTKEGFHWYAPVENIKNKYQFTKQGKYVLSQVEKWLRAKKWCDERNIPHKRGCLLYGKPGTGKSSLILEIAKTLRIPILYFDTAEMCNQEFSEKIRDLTTESAIILFEDFDGQYNKREPKNKSNYQGLTFDFFLNKISGVNSLKNKFIFITTNDISQIDDALLREGRLDYKIELESLSMEDKLNMAKTTLDGKEELIKIAMENSASISTAEFENKIIQIALDNYYGK